jgi:hypothetical protein
MANERQEGSIAERVQEGGAQSAEQSAATTAGRRTYSPPQLKRLGSVAELTFESAKTVLEKGGTKKG